MRSVVKSVAFFLKKKLFQLFEYTNCFIPLQCDTKMMESCSLVIIVSTISSMKLNEYTAEQTNIEDFYEYIDYHLNINQ